MPGVDAGVSLLHARSRMEIIFERHRNFWAAVTFQAGRITGTS